MKIESVVAQMTDQQSKTQIPFLFWDSVTPVSAHLTRVSSYRVKIRNSIQFLESLSVLKTGGLKKETKSPSTSAFYFPSQCAPDHHEKLYSCIFWLTCFEAAVC